MTIPVTRFEKRSGSEIAFFVALLSTALALGPALAHALELPNKIAMNEADYFTVQRIYAGWNRIAAVLLVQFAAILAVIFVHRRDPAVRYPALLALAALIAAQAVFWTYTQPANLATDHWTRQPAEWSALRDQWEYSHLAGAMFQLIAMGALILAVLERQPFDEGRQASRI